MDILKDPSHLPVIEDAIVKYYHPSGVTKKDTKDVWQTLLTFCDETELNDQT